MSTKKTKINILFYISQCPFILSKPRVRDNSALGLQVCLAINNEDAEYFWHEEHQVPNIVWDNDQWLGFDDPTSLAIKVKLAKHRLQADRSMICVIELTKWIIVVSLL